MVTVEPTQATATPAPTDRPARGVATPTARDPACQPDEVARLRQALPPYQPGDAPFVKLSRDGFVLAGKPFIMRGINYYPAESPFYRFTQTSLGVIEQDFARLRAANVNTLRLFLRYEPFFLCPGAVPNPPTFRWLDSVLRLANAYGFRVILVLHDLPDLNRLPLYDTLDEVTAQTEAIVSRYRAEPAILAWDLRDAGDADYTPFSDDPPPVTRAQVLDWLARTAAAVRQIDPWHPITAGWADDSEATISLVDFVSFQHFGDDQSLRQRIAALRAYTDKPLLLIALGSSTLEITEIEQAQRLRATVRAAEADAIAGWLVWTMYDFPVSVTCYPEPCASFDDARHHFGLWRSDGTRKPGANALETLAAGF
jgi:hypothetical protein